MVLKVQIKLFLHYFLFITWLLYCVVDGQSDNKMKKVTDYDTAQTHNLDFCQRSEDQTSNSLVTGWPLYCCLDRFLINCVKSLQHSSSLFLDVTHPNLVKWSNTTYSYTPTHIVQQRIRGKYDIWMFSSGVGGNVVSFQTVTSGLPLITA